MQNNKIDILCTRPLNETIIQKAAIKNITIDTIPFIETQPLNNSACLEQIQLFSEINMVAVFTSMNAVESVYKNTNGKVNWTIFCLGGITKDLVQQYFGKACVAGTAKNASLLATKIIAAKNIREVVFFCGDQHLDFLPQALRDHKIKVKECVVYKTIPVIQVVEKNYDGMVFFSPSAVHSFFSVNTIGQDVVLFAIGDTTATAAKTYCTNKIITSEWPGKEQLIDRAIQYFEKIKGSPVN